MMSDLEKLLQQKATLDKRIKQVQAKEREKQRKEDTRRKIVAGAVVLTHCEHDPAFKAQLLRLLNSQVKKPADRLLLGLEPLEVSAEDAPQQQAE